ncbi:MAG: BatA domain-containing protein [Kiritimatiellia bacterium]|jgi:hypothetical protein|nr:BatA domain-containing protein [Kiritimatiellia bacterium]
MNFLNPIALWAGLGAVGIAVPIIIHLLYRKHKRQTDWAAMELLRRALVIRSGQVRLEDYLLLFLRCLLLALTALALLRPTVRRVGTVLSGGQQRIGAVVAIDASYSMAHGKLSNRYEQAVEKAREILSTVNVGDPTTVVLMGNRPRMILRATGYDERRFAEALEQTATLPERLNIERCLAELAELVTELKTPVRECYILTDAQATDWTTLSDEARARMEEIAESANLFIVPIPVGGEENLGVTSFEYASGSLRRSGMARFSAQISNSGRRPQGDATATFYIDDQAITRQALGAIAPGSSKVVSFFASFDDGGTKKLKVSLGPDALNIDNARHAVVDVRSRVSVLCVDGEPSAEPWKSEVFFMVRALRLKEGGSEAALNVANTHWQDLPAEDFSQYDVIALANVPSFDEEMGKRLVRFVSRGGGLIVFTGDLVDPEAYNTSLQHEGELLLPGELHKAVKSSAGGADATWSLGPVRSDHVLARLAKALPQEELDTARFIQSTKVEVGEGGVTILSLTGQDTPLLLEKKTGQGTVLLCTTTADREWSNLAIHPLFPMMMQQAVTYLTSRPGDRQFLVGDPAHIVIDGAEAGTSAVLLDPKGRESSVKLLAREGTVPACPVETEIAGIFEAVVIDKEPSPIAVNIDPMEADVRVLDGAVIERELGGIDVHVVAQGDSLASIVKENRIGRELSRMLLIMAVILFLAQSWLARFFTRRMRTGETDVTESMRKKNVAAARKT